MQLITSTIWRSLKEDTKDFYHPDNRIEGEEFIPLLYTLVFYIINSLNPLKFMMKYIKVSDNTWEALVLINPSFLHQSI